MDPYLAGWILGAVTGGLAGVMGLLTYQWIDQRRVWRERMAMDHTLERLRRLQ